MILYQFFRVSGGNCRIKAAFLSHKGGNCDKLIQRKALNT